MLLGSTECGELPVDSKVPENSVRQDPASSCRVLEPEKTRAVIWVQGSSLKAGQRMRPPQTGRVAGESGRDGRWHRLYLAHVGPEVFEVSELLRFWILARTTLILDPKVQWCSEDFGFQRAPFGKCLHF